MSKRKSKQQPVISDEEIKAAVGPVNEKFVVSTFDSVAPVVDNSGVLYPPESIDDVKPPDFAIEIIGHPLEEEPEPTTGGLVTPECSYPEPDGFSAPPDLELEEVEIVAPPVPPPSDTRAGKEYEGFKHAANVSCGYGVMPGCRNTVELWHDHRGKRYIVNPMPSPESKWVEHDRTCPVRTQR